jgi:hypothetical protein
VAEAFLVGGVMDGIIIFTLYEISLEIFFPFSFSPLLLSFR